MADEKKTRKRRSKKEVEVVETVTTPAVEESIVETIEDYDKVDDTPITDTVEIIEPAVEDTELKKEDIAVDEIKADESVKEEKPKRTRKPKKAESENTENAEKTDVVAADTAETEKPVGSDRANDAPIVITKSIWLYKSSIGNAYIMPIKGTFYRWRDDVVTGRICITDSPENKGVFGKNLGWINESDIK